MTLVDAIASIHTQSGLSEDEKRQQTYALKCKALRDVIVPMLGREVAHAGLTYRINKVEVTPQYRLALDVTFTRDGNEVTHQINITNPPLLPRERTGNEKEDLRAAVSEMLEGFV